MLSRQARLRRGFELAGLELHLLVLLFASFLAIPLTCQCFLHALLFAWFQIKGVTLDFLDDVLLLNLALEATQCIFERLAFLNANLCQKLHLQTVPVRAYTDYRNSPGPTMIYRVPAENLMVSPFALHLPSRREIVCQDAKLEDAKLEP